MGALIAPTAAAAIAGARARSPEYERYPTVGIDALHLTGVGATCMCATLRLLVKQSRLPG